MDIPSVFSINAARYRFSLLSYPERLRTSLFGFHLVVFILSDNGVTSGWKHPEGDGHPVCAVLATRPAFLQCSQMLPLFVYIIDPSR